MAKLTNAAVYSALMALSALSERKLPVRAAIQVAKAHRVLREEWEDVEKLREKMIEEYAERDENGEKVRGEEINGQATVRIRPDVREQFNKEWKELLNSEVEVDVTISLADFGSDVEIEPSILDALDPLLIH